MTQIQISNKVTIY